MRLSWITAVIIFLGGGVFGYNMFSKDRVQATEIRKQVKEQYAVGKQRIRLEESLSLIESYRRRLSPEPQTAWLLRTVGKLAEEARINLSGINPQTPRALGDLSEFSVALRFSSSYHELGEFLSLIESNPKLLRIERLEFKPLISEANDLFEANVTLVVSTLFLPPVRI